MPSRAVVAVGASAGGVEALSRLVAYLPADLPAAVLVVVHVPPGADSHLPAILTRSGPLPAHHALDGETLVDGKVFVAPPDGHLTIRDGHVQLDRGPRQNRHRPAIDPLLRSVARWRNGRSVAVILSGVQSDGVSGAIAVCRNGGVVLVQDPDEATFPGMPAAVLGRVPGSQSMPIEDMGERIDELVRDRAGSAWSGVARQPASEEVTAMGSSSPVPSDDGIEVPIGDDVRYGCPDCGGVLTEIPEGDHLRFRCRVGHEYAAEDLLSAQSVALENALWSALRGLEERSELARRLGDRVADSSPAVAARHHERAAETTAEADLIRDFLLRLPVERDPAAG